MLSSGIQSVQEVRDSHGAITYYLLNNYFYVPLIDGNPRYEAIKEWIGNGNKAGVLSLDPEPNWEGFNLAFLNDLEWQQTESVLPNDLRNAMISTAANGNLAGLQSSINIAKMFLLAEGRPLTDEVRTRWQNIAGVHNIEVIF